MYTTVRISYCLRKAAKSDNAGAKQTAATQKTDDVENVSAAKKTGLDIHSKSHIRKR